MKVRRAISPVIATLLLILIAVAASILVYVWVTGYASSVTGAEATQLQERIKIDAVGITNATNVTVYVRNIGEIEVNVTDVYIIDSQTSQILGRTHLTGNSGVIAPGSVLSVVVDNLSPAMSTGKTYIAKAVTANGVEATQTFVYRG